MENIHHPFEPDSDLDQLRQRIQQSREQCSRRGLSPEDAAFQTDKLPPLAEIKEHNKRLFVYSNSVLARMRQLIPPHERVGYGIYSADGYLLKRYGSSQFIDWCDRRGIAPGLRWDEASIGTNAIDLGLRSHAYAEVLGEDHLAPFLQDTACYFEPVSNTLCQEGKTVKRIHGGLAIFCPVENANPLLRSLVTSVSREISLQYLWFDNLDLYMSTIQGISYIFLDKSLGRNSIIAVGSSVVRAAEYARRDYYYQDLEALIPCIGKNKEFWQIINTRTECSDQYMTLWVKNEPQKLSVSTVNFQDERFHMDGVLITFSSMRRIKQIITKYVGLTARLSFQDIIGSSPNFLSVVGYAKDAASTDCNILLLGESGTGKDVFAQAIHNQSERKNGPFVAINCAALSRELIYSELFGYEAGAYTGARSGGNIGKFELANHGTLFLDEIGDMPLDLQATLLRVIEQNSFMRLGSSTMTQVDVRIIAATNADLKARIRDKLFREDLFFRLGVVRIYIPPLRERGDDVLLMMTHFIQRKCRQLGRPPLRLSPQLTQLLRSYAWPGNVRELQNLLEGLLNVDHGDEPDVDFVRRYLALPEQDQSDRPDGQPPQLRASDFSPHSQQRIREALARCRNNRSAAAAYLGISRSTLYRKMKEYGLLD